SNQPGRTISSPIRRPSPQGPDGAGGRITDAPDAGDVSRHPGGQRLKRELRKQIRQDELVSGFEQAMAWSRAHKHEVKIGGRGPLLVLVVGGGLTYFVRHRHDAAESAFGEALRTFQAPVAGETDPGEPPPTGGPTFATAKEKFEKAAAAFDGVERRYPS